MVKPVAVVTGGNGGIGSAVVRSLAQGQFRTAVLYVNDADTANTLAEEVGGIAIRADLRSEVEVIGAVERVRAELGPVDVLVNNAGIQERVPFLEMSASQFDNMISSNLRSAFLLMRAVVPEMAKRRTGKVINISSQTALIGRSEMAHYAAAKAGLIAMSKSIARELAPHGVLVNVVAPGAITSGPSLSASEDRMSYMASIPLRRFGTPDEVAETVLFLAHGGNYYTGWVFSMNGGEVM